MSLKERMNEDIKEAMRNKDQAALRALRAIKSAIIIAETAEGHKGELTSEEEIKLLTKQAKQRKESIDQFTANNRTDLVKTEEEELEIIQRYLPKQLSDEDIEKTVRTTIQEINVSSPADMGKVIGAVNKKLAGQADGKKIADTVKKCLGA